MERWRIKLVHLFKLNPHRDVVRGTEEEFIEDINDRAFLAYKPVSYPGKMTICKPRRNYAFLRDPFNGWGGIFRANPGGETQGANRSGRGRLRRSSQSAGSGNEIGIGLGTAKI